MRKIILILTVLVVLAAININIYQREQLLRNGRVVLLELAPVDPRSLMQGDYMALRFGIANRAFAQNDLQTLNDGYLILTVDEQNVASFSRFAARSSPAVDEVLFRYRIRNGRVKFATNAFFFQEGHAKDYENARFGEFRVDPNG